MTEFQTFNKAINRQLGLMMTLGELFTVDIDKDTIWQTYLSSFREGDNPIYKERTEHDCNCCKQFIRDIGRTVAISNGEVLTIWDVDTKSDIYQPVADAMHELVKNAAIKNVYRHIQAQISTPQNHQQTENGDIIKWEHFSAKLKNVFVHTSRDESLSQFHGNAHTNFSVLKRSLDEISLEAIQIVEDLIDQNSIYRGEEFKPVVRDLKRYKKAYDKLSTYRGRELYLWSTSVKLGFSGRYKNTAIGTLLHDLSTGVELEDAVKMFESKVAPENYKRSSALITQGMIKKAQADVEKLGIEDSLHRRFAVETDLTINNVLFADRSTQRKMNGVFDELVAETKTKKPSTKKVDDISIEDFVENVLPKAESLELYVTNKHLQNFVSLIAPVHDDAPNIMKWDNNFSWSYVGEVTDSIKERVKAAGGQVDADVRVSLSWSNYDDLDLHVIEPDGNEIYFSCPSSRTTGGKLDVDMNAGGSRSRTPVENIFWKDQTRMKTGTYKVVVHNFSKRETKDVGFEIQFASGSDSETFFHPKDVKNGERVTVLEFTYSRSEGAVVSKRHVDSESKPKESWGINTQNFQKVKMVMASPNHWDDQEVGNKHWFFMLENCVNPDPARGFYNEFLRGDLTKHRKVFEVLSSKMKTQESDDQLSGLGFSSTKRNEMLVKVSGSFNRTLNVKF